MNFPRSLIALLPVAATLSLPATPRFSRETSSAKSLILNCCFHHCQSPGYLYALGATQARAGTTNQAISTLQRAHAEALCWQQPQLAQAITRDLSKIPRSPF